MGLACGWRTGATVGSEAKAVGAFGEGVIALQVARAGGDIVDDPMVDCPIISCFFVGRSKPYRATRSYRSGSSFFLHFF